MRRILLRLVVVAILGAVAAVMAVPALADPEDCTAGGAGGGGGRDEVFDPISVTGGQGGITCFPDDNTFFGAGGGGFVVTPEDSTTIGTGGHQEGDFNTGSFTDQGGWNVDTPDGGQTGGRCVNSYENCTPHKADYYGV
jgi:hypothetical protein